MVVLIPVLAEPELPDSLNSMQCQLLAVQLSQHVQLMVQQFVMNYKHPVWHEQSLTCKENLESLRYEQLYFIYYIRILFIIQK